MNTDKSIRVSPRANDIFETYLFFKNKDSKVKLTKRDLMEQYANQLAKTKMVTH